MLSLTTFRDIGPFEIGQLRQDEPSCFNGQIRVRRFRIYVEPIPEEESILIGRLQKLYDNSTNIHHRNDLLKYAKEKHRYDLHNKEYYP